MGKLSAIADRIATTKARLDSEADKLGEKLDIIDRDAPVAFQRSHNFLDSQKAEVAEIESTLRQLSNLPLDDLPASPSASPDAGLSMGSQADPANHAPFVRRLQQP